jgi:hypothetical protein
MLDHTSKITPAELADFMPIGASQGMTTTLRGQPTRAAAERAKAMANSVEANQRRRRREPPVIDWDKAIAKWLDILDDIYNPHV